MSPKRSAQADAICIAYAEDHTLFRKAVIDCINRFKDCHVVLEAANGRQLIEGLERSECLPELCILDISMPEISGHEALVEIRRRWPEMGVLVLSMHDAEYHIIRMLQAGANGYLLKDCQPEELHAAIRSIAETGVYSSDTVVSRKLFRSVRSGGMKPPELTGAEIEFLRLCCSDLCYKEIAVRMNITRSSAEWHRETLFKKLVVKSRSGLVLFAIRTGLVCIDEDKMTSKSIPYK